MNHDHFRNVLMNKLCCSDIKPQNRNELKDSIDELKKEPKEELTSNLTKLKNRKRPRKTEISKKPRKERKLASSKPKSPKRKRKSEKAAKQESTEEPNDELSDSTKPDLPKRKKKCPHCDYESSNSGNMYLHKFKHSTDRSFLCKTCGMAFARPDSLKVHEQIHLENRPVYKCPICSKQLSTKITLKEHIVKHSRDEPHQCDLCGKTYKVRKSLMVHKRQQHDEPSRFVCHVCGKGCKSKALLKQHVFNHEEEKRFSCSQCGSAFKSDLLLKNHELIHTETENKYECTICGTKLRQRRYLANHMLTKHKMRTKEWAKEYTMDLPLPKI